VLIDTLSIWRPFSNSSPVEGITAATNSCYEPDKNISLYVFGDELSGRDTQSVITTLNRVNKAGKEGMRRIRIHAVPFPVTLSQRLSDDNTGVRFTNLMLILCQKNGGTFVGFIQPGLERLSLPTAVNFIIFSQI